MTEQAYQNREIDAKFTEVHHRFDDQDAVLKRMEGKQDYTNGKLKKVIIALAILFGFALGMMGKEILPILSKLII